MKTTYVHRAIRSASRHRRRTAQIGLLTTTVLSRGAHARGHYRGLADPVRRAATDRRVHRQSRRAAADVAGAVRRAGRVGIADAMTDRRVATGLRKAGRHASRALALTISPPPSHKKRNTAIVALGIGGATAGAIVAKRRFQPAGQTPPTPTPPDVPVTEAPDVTESAPEPETA